MTDVVFSQSACGSLKIARQYMAGDAAGVFGIDAAWSMGDISDCEIGDGRRKVLERVFSIWPANGDAGRQIDEQLHVCRFALREVLRRSSQGEPARIWFSHNPDELCGLYWLLARLGQIAERGPVYLVKCPKWEYMGDYALCTHTGWGDIAPEEWKNYLPSQQEVKPALIAACAMRWGRLQEENAPLRVYLNGRLQSAPEDFYDSFILREIESQADEFSEAELIGGVLGKYQLGIGDAWIALRIEEFIRRGTLEAVTSYPPGGPVYRRMLCKNHTAE